MSNRKINYYQLGSVSPTSFKIEPIASGIIKLNGINSDSEVSIKIFNNKKIVMLSIGAKEYLPELIKFLKYGKSYGTVVFLKYPFFLKSKIEPLLKEYPEIKGVLVV